VYGDAAARVCPVSTVKVNVSVVQAPLDVVKLTENLAASFPERVMGLEATAFVSTVIATVEPAARL
jgi:hypothetical protein